MQPSPDKALLALSEWMLKVGAKPDGIQSITVYKQERHTPIGVRLESIRIEIRDHPSRIHEHWPQIQRVLLGMNSAASA